MMKLGYTWVEKVAGVGLVLWDSEDRLIACNEQYRKFFQRHTINVTNGVNFRDLVEINAHNKYIRQLNDLTNSHLKPEEYISLRSDLHYDTPDYFHLALSSGNCLLVRERRIDDGMTIGTYSEISTNHHGIFSTRPQNNEKKYLVVSPSIISRIGITQLLQKETGNSKTFEVEKLDQAEGVIDKGEKIDLAVLISNDRQLHRSIKEFTKTRKVRSWLIISDRPSDGIKALQSTISNFSVLSPYAEKEVIIHHLFCSHYGSSSDSEIDKELPEIELSIQSLNNFEQKILKKLAQGSNNKDIANSLGIAQQSVRNKLVSIYKKLGVNNRTSAALLYDSYDNQT